MKYENLVELPRKYGCTCRIHSHLGLSDWSTGAIIPSPSYLELPRVGPLALSDIDWFELNPIEKRKEGRLIPETVIDHTVELERELSDIGFKHAVVEGNLRVEIKLEPAVGGTPSLRLSVPHLKR